MTNPVTGRPITEMVRPAYDWNAPCYRNPTRWERFTMRLAKLAGLR